MNNPDFRNTKAALLIWEADEPRRDALLNAAQTNDEVAAWERQEDEAARKLQDAFFEDTKAYNKLSTIRNMHPRTIQKFITTGKF